MEEEWADAERLEGRGERRSTWQGEGRKVKREKLPGDNYVGEE